MVPTVDRKYFFILRRRRGDWVCLGRTGTAYWREIVRRCYSRSSWFRIYNRDAEIDDEVNCIEHAVASSGVGEAAGCREHGTKRERTERSSRTTMSAVGSGSHPVLCRREVLGLVSVETSPADPRDLLGEADPDTEPPRFDPDSLVGVGGLESGGRGECVSFGSLSSQFPLRIAKGEQK